MAVITTILGVGFLFAILFLVKTSTLPDYLQVAIKGLKALSIIAIFGGIGTWVYYQFQNDITREDFIGSWQLTDKYSSYSKGSYEFLKDFTFYRKGEDEFVHGTWNYDSKKEILTLYILDKIEGKRMEKLSPALINEIDIIKKVQNKIYLDETIYLLKSEIPFGLEKEYTSSLNHNQIK